MALLISESTDVAADSEDDSIRGEYMLGWSGLHPTDLKEDCASALAEAELRQSCNE